MESWNREKQLRHELQQIRAERQLAERERDLLFDRLREQIPRDRLTDFDNPSREWNRRHTHNPSYSRLPIRSPSTPLKRIDSQLHTRSPRMLPTPSRVNSQNQLPLPHRSSSSSLRFIDNAIYDDITWLNGDSSDWSSCGERNSPSVSSTSPRPTTSSSPAMSKEVQTDVEGDSSVSPFSRGMTRTPSLTSVVNSPSSQLSNNLPEYFVQQLRSVSPSRTYAQPVESSTKLPSIHALNIIGEPRVGCVLSVNPVLSNPELHTISLCNWYMVHPSLRSQYPEGRLVLQLFTKSVVLSTREVGYFLAAEYTPVDWSGKSGSQMTAITHVPVYEDNPSNPIDLVGLAMEGQTLTANLNDFSAQNAHMRWYCGETLLQVNGLQYTVTSAEVGRHIKFEYIAPPSQSDPNPTPVWVVTPVIQPLALSGVHIVGNLVVGSELEVIFNSTTKDLNIEWFRVPERHIGSLPQNVRKITLTDKDVGCQIKVIVTAFVEGEEIPQVAITTDKVSSCSLPKIVECYLDGCPQEGCELTIRAKADYFDRRPGPWKFIWKRADVLLPNNTPRHVCVLEDVGKVLTVACIPTDDQGLEGEPYLCISDPVEAVGPSLLRLQFSSTCCGWPMEVVYRFVGGTEKGTTFVWWRSKDGENWDKMSDVEDIHTFIKCQVTPSNSFGKTGPTQEIQGYIGLSAKYRREIHRALKEGIIGFNVKSESDERVQIFMRHKDLVVILVTTSESKKILSHTKWPRELGINLIHDNDTGFSLIVTKKSKTLNFTIARRDARDKIILIFRAFHSLSHPELSQTAGVTNETLQEWKKGSITSLEPLRKPLPRDPNIPLSAKEKQVQQEILGTYGAHLYLAYNTMLAMLEGED
eukprot:NODE_313_length_2972_cov_65.605125_g271_i0.p1 GENE.NODE_313_length_2972_cov_65.605125_g271_i0~~NODE_313_length_2972_cov_65.605125_g271_i0.p1  ORF type:complete len:864 (-),score=179.86 NODE_313_length_2972_cov_65.605125_g271_i0:256-2847(-)